jgi:DNA-binding NarL/FixJ family response regulator
MNLPQLGEANTNYLPDVNVTDYCYSEGMKRVFIADRQPEARAAFRLLLLVLNMQVVGEAADWPATLTQAPATLPDIVMVDGNLLSATVGATLAELRQACSRDVVIVLISHLDAREQAAVCTGSDIFINKGETPDRVAEYLRTAARGSKAKGIAAD